MNRSRFVIALAMVGFALLSYYGVREKNPITGESQHVGLSQEQEVVLGLQSAPEMADQFGGLDPDASVQSDVETVGKRVVSQSVAQQTPYKFQFHVLADPQTVNAFALPGGPVFITRGLLQRLGSEAQLAGVLGHEVGHVVARHASEQIAKSQLAQGLVGAVGVATSDQQAAQADALGVDLMSSAGYDPREMIEVMSVLKKASGGSRQPEFLSTHPDPGNREEKIRQQITAKYPGGVPANLTRGREIRMGDASP